MFSSSNSDNPLPHLPSSFHLSSPSLTPHNSHEMFLHHHHHHKDLLVGHYLSPTNIGHDHQGLERSVSNQGVLNGVLGGGDLYDHSNSFPKKKPVKKDRHSKISTAKGPRERRVRLSIGIARRFFDLQDMLGFDKASKTLDWLFGKSNTAITELVHMKHKCNGDSKSSSLGSECVVVSRINEAADVNGDTQGMIVSNKKKSLRPKKAALRLLSRESRAKARERARERTRKKMCTDRSRLNESDHKKISNSRPSAMLNQSTLSQTCEKLGSHSVITISSINLDGEIEYSPMSHPQVVLNHQAPRDDQDIIDESIVMKRKLEPSLLFDNYEQDLSNYVSSNGNNYSPNMAQRWDIGTAIARSSFCVMTNMNLSTEFQIYGKPWEVYNNHSQL